METNPYRHAAEAGASGIASARSIGCVFCRARAAFARLSWRALLVGAFAVLFTGANLTSAVAAARSLREAKKTLATADSLDSAARTTLSRYEARLRESTTHSPEPARAPTAAPLDAEPGIVRLSATEFYVDRHVVDEALSDGAERPGHPSLTPARENGKVSGVRVSGIRSGTLLATLGLQDGDVIQAVDGFDITRPENALEAYARLRSAADLVVRVGRRGSTVFLRYHLT